MKIMVSVVGYNAVSVSVMNSVDDVVCAVLPEVDVPSLSRHSRETGTLKFMWTVEQVGVMKGGM